MILLVRCVLFLIFALSALGNGSVGLIAITSVTAGLAVLAWIHSRVYVKLYNDILEGFFILNLCIFAVATYHVQETGGSQARLAYTSVGIAFAIFICIVFYHIYLILHKTSALKKLPKPNAQKYFIMRRFVESSTNEDGQSDCKQENLSVLAPTSTIVELREPLLDKSI